MNEIDFDYQILKLSELFYKKYPFEEYKEIEQKVNRAHKNAFHFKKSQRSKMKMSALDYSKIVIVKDGDYLKTPALIDNDEYVETVNNINHIANAARKYVEEYILYATGIKNIKSRTYERKYKYTSLKYFHDILGINGV